MRPSKYGTYGQTLRLSRHFVENTSGSKQLPLARLISRYLSHHLWLHHALIFREIVTGKQNRTQSLPFERIQFPDAITSTACHTSLYCCRNNRAVYRQFCGCFPKDRPMVLWSRNYRPHKDNALISLQLGSKSLETQYHNSQGTACNEGSVRWCLSRDECEPVHTNTRM